MGDSEQGAGMSGRKRVVWLTAFFGMVMFAANASADMATATIGEATTSGVSGQVGLITFEDSKFGLLVKPDLAGLEAGPHGVHVHENPDCNPSKSGGMAMAAGAAGGISTRRRPDDTAGPTATVIWAICPTFSSSRTVR